MKKFLLTIMAVTMIFPTLVSSENILDLESESQKVLSEKEMELFLQNRYSLHVNDFDKSKLLISIEGPTILTTSGSQNVSVSILTWVYVATYEEKILDCLDPSKAGFTDVTPCTINQINLMLHIEKPPQTPEEYKEPRINTT